jgi:hypothetical protein
MGKQRKLRQRLCKKSIKRFEKVLYMAGLSIFLSMCNSSIHIALWATLFGLSEGDYIVSSILVHCKPSPWFGMRLHRGIPRISVPGCRPSGLPFSGVGFVDQL